MLLLELFSALVMVIGTVARQVEGITLPQWFGLDPWKFITPESNWVIRENEWVCLERLYRTFAGTLVAQDLGPPALKDLNIQTNRRSGTICFCRQGWHLAWLSVGPAESGGIPPRVEDIVLVLSVGYRAKGTLNRRF